MADQHPEWLRIEDDVPEYVRLEDDKPAETAPRPDPTPGVVETFGRSFLNGAVPGTHGGDATAARVDAVNGLTHPELLDDASIARGTANQIGRSVAGAQANPISAGAGKVAGELTGFALNPLNQLGAGAMLKAAGPATEVLTSLGPKAAEFYPWLMRAATGAGIGGLAAATKGGDPNAGAGMGALYGTAPVATSIAQAASSALDPDLSPADTAASVLGNALGVAGGVGAKAVGKFGEMAPWLRTQANENAVRAAGLNLPALKKIGSVERARDVGGQLLNDKLIPWFGTKEQNAANISDAHQQAGQAIGQDLNGRLSNPSPEQQLRTSPMVLQEVVRRKLQDEGMLPKSPTDASNVLPPDQRFVSPAQKLVDSFDGRGDQSYGMTGLNDIKAKFGSSAYNVADPNVTPSDQKVVGQAAYNALSDHQTQLANEISPEATSVWQQNKDRYSKLSDAVQPSNMAALRDLANRQLSLSSNLAATGGGVTPGSVAKGLGNQALLNRGNSFLANLLDRAANMSEAVPKSPFRPSPNSTPVSPGPTPAPFPGATPPPVATRDYGNMTPEQVKVLGMADGLHQIRAQDMLDNGRSYRKYDVREPETGRVLIPASDPGGGYPFKVLNEAIDVSLPPAAVPRPGESQKFDPPDASKVLDAVLSRHEPLGPTPVVPRRNDPTAPPESTRVEGQTPKKRRESQ